MFCQSCGAQVTGSFCTKCGARASQASAPPPLSVPPPPPPPVQQYAPPPPPPQYAQPLAPAAKSGSGLKILFVVLGVFGVMAMVFIGLFWYAAHKVKQIASNNGIDLNGITETHQGPVRRFDACELLTKDELSQILKLNIERVESTGKSSTSTCSYYSSEAQQRGLDEAAAAKKRIEDAAKAGNGKTDPAKNATVHQCRPQQILARTIAEQLTLVLEPTEPLQPRPSVL
jgi:hypothetical protein